MFEREREREREREKSVDVGMRIIRFESFEEGPITPLHAREIVRERERERERERREREKETWKQGCICRNQGHQI